MGSATKDGCKHAPEGRNAGGAEPDKSTLPIFKLLRERKGVDFAAYCQSTIRRRLNDRMKGRGISVLKEYIDVLKSDPVEAEVLFHSLLVRTTAFFREPETCEILRTSILPKLIANQMNNDAVRLWVPGCASGEEVYSLAILLLDCMHATNVYRRIQIFGTDVNDDLLRRARFGRYLPRTIKDVSKERLKLYFVRLQDGFEIARQVRNVCTFAHHDLLSDPAFSKMDLISCQNVLLYLSRPKVNKVLQDFYFALNPGGLSGAWSCGEHLRPKAFILDGGSLHRIYQSSRPAARSVLNSAHHAARSTFKTAINEHGSANHALPSLQREFALQGMEAACAEQEVQALREDLSWVRDELRKEHDKLEERVAERTAELQKTNAALQREMAVQKRLEAEILRISEEERRRIAQDVHDGLGQQLTGALHLLTDLRQRLAKKSPVEAKSAERLLELISEAVEQTRGLAKGISPVEDVPDGLHAAFQQLAARTQRIHHVRCRFVASSVACSAHNATATHLYRIAQEAVSNAIRHARPRHIDISLQQTPKQLMLAVSDDGCGLPAANATGDGMGLRIMEYRAHLIGATLEITRRKPRGTTVVCRLKLLNEQKA